MTWKRYNLWVAIMLFAIARTSFASWTVTIITNGTESFLSDIQNGQYAGSLDGHATTWMDNTVTDLHPAGNYSSYLLATTGSQQAGVVIAQQYGREHATMWSGSQASRVDLHPSGFDWSYAYDISTNDQVGSVQRSGQNPQAALWHGSAASFINLNPSGANYSIAKATTGQTQVGYAIIGVGDVHAGLWHGTSNSWVDLNPSNAVYSQATAVAGTQQGGYAIFQSNTNPIHAVIWSGSSNSCVDLNPPETENSMLFGTTGNFQCGVTYQTDMYEDGRAAVWHSASDSWIDLHQFLPTNALVSWANAIVQQGNSLYVVGTVEFSDTERGVIWSIGNPQILTQPRSVTLTAGSTSSLTVSAASDNPIVYQWRKDTNPIPDATNSYLLLTNVTPSAAGYYDVLVSSGDAILTSQRASVALFGIQSTFVGNQFFPFLTVDGPPGATYTIQFTTNLFNNIWTPLTTSVLGSNRFYYADTSAPADASRIYRAIPQ